MLLSLLLQMSPEHHHQQQQDAEEACQLPPAQVDLSFVVQGKQGGPQQRVAVVVSDRVSQNASAVCFMHLALHLVGLLVSTRFSSHV